MYSLIGPVTAVPCMDSVQPDSSDTSFGDLSLSCSFSQVKEHRQTLEGKNM